ncbi:hypothetical protein MW290_24745 [Aquincola tertiaricarbonis]|uniref:Uncharacterized protein n=1 Tax=Aquincola tertiaricarbonis TaxID=391953 RepID=A0ABY4SC35_AQUTE|nr:hypothetical protein [Aquincola tertiaricarbonis]URI08789.1 hypothetical protein MW290_24745 [Aquincola tertiaricarbonis]
MRELPKWGTAPIRCGRMKCKWRGFETDLAQRAGSLGGITCTTSVCPACGCDSYMHMTEREVKAWERSKAAHAGERKEPAA